MPIYAYKCSSCGHSLDVMQKISDAPLAVCRACGQSTFSKQVTAAGFQLKGSGWYATDFKNSVAQKPAEKTDPKTDAKVDAKSDSSSDTKAEVKSGATTDVQSGSKDSAGGKKPPVESKPTPPAARDSAAGS